MSESNLVLAVSLFLSAGLCSCTGLGSSSLVDLYDRASPTGMIEIEMERNGAIKEIEAEISPTELPTIVRDAAMQRAPGGTITGAEREINQDGKCWEVKMNYQGRGWEFIVDDMGKILETEKELRRNEAPAAVLTAADEAIPGGAFVSVEVIETMSAGKTKTCYHVKKTRDGASYKIVLAEDGKVLRKVREAKAEIEIPLKN
jgi:hypothetical protein